MSQPHAAPGGARVPLPLPVKITITENSGRRTIEVDGTRTVTIGRADDNTIALETSRSSRRHAEIIGEGGLFTLIDLGSANGTIVDGEKVTKKPLDGGAEIRIGEATIVFGERLARPTHRPSSRRAAAGGAKPRKPSAPATAARASEATPSKSPSGSARAASPPPPSPPPASSPAPRGPAVVEDENAALRRVLAGVAALVVLFGIAWAVKELQAPLDPDLPGATVAEHSDDRSTDHRAAHSDSPDGRTNSSSTDATSIDGEPKPASSDIFRPLDIPDVELPGDFDEEPASRRSRRPDAMALEEWLAENERLGVDEAIAAPVDPGAGVSFDGSIETPVRIISEEPRPLLAIIADGWPPGSRTIGYEYNQKNHGAPGTFVGRTGDSLPERSAATQGNRFRVIGVEISPRDLEPGARVHLRSEQIERGEKIPVKVPAPIPGGPRLPDRIRKYFAIEEPEDRKVVVDLLAEDGRTLVTTTEMILPEGGRTTPLASQAIAIRDERQREEWERSQLATRTVTIEVFDDRERPVPDAHVMLLIEGGGLVTFTGRTDESGRFRREVVPGAYTVLVHGDVPEPEQTGMTQVEVMPRLLSLQGRLGPSDTHLRFEPQRTVLVEILAEGEQRLPIERIVVTPGPIAEAYKYERVATEIAGRGRLEVNRTAPGGLHLILGDQPVELALLGRTPDGEPVLITETVQPSRGDCVWNFRRDRFSTIEFDPARSFGGVTRVSGNVVAASAFRERFTFDTDRAWRAYVMPGKYRITVAAEVGGESAQFLPYAVKIGSGQAHDLTPRGPWRLTLYQKRMDRQQQLWLAVVDAGGRILHAPPGEPGHLRALSGQTAKIEQTLSRFAWIEAERLLGIDLGKLKYETRIPFGAEEIAGFAELKQLQVFNAAGSSSTAPGVFEQRILEILPEIQRTVLGAVETTGLPEGMRRIHLELDIFLPPGVGGTGGGGVITLDTAVMHRYACAGDPLPGAYRHEFGHNMGFGHDPYMLIAEGGSATDEALFGKLGYALLNAEAAVRSLDYLLEDRGAEGLRWSPSPTVFPALRALYGSDIHERMLTERKRSEQTMVLHGLSSIERIAALYSLVLDRNVAWLFRAHGWPVFDARVDLGGKAVKFIRNHPRQLNYTHVPGTEISGWWVLDVDGEEQPPEWQRVFWPTANIDLAIDQQPIEQRKSRRWLFFRRIVVAENTDARILCASDCALEVRVNGEAVGVSESSPQQTQPVHDELMLDQKRPFPVFLSKGENFIEVAVNQSSGSRGFVLALATPEGEPLRLGIVDDGPPGESHSKRKPKEVEIHPVLGGSFEQGIAPAWIEGATDPPGSLHLSLDDRQKVHGKRSLRIDIQRPAEGAIIQRVFIPPGRAYDLRAALRTQGFKGEAFVGLFTGELGGWKSRTEPLRKSNQAWKPFVTTWSPGASRVVYVACFVKGTAGSVWFDAVQLVPKK